MRTRIRAVKRTGVKATKKIRTAERTGNKRHVRTAKRTGKQ